MKKDEIDIAQIDIGSLAEKARPATFQYRIYMAPEAYDAIWKQARESPDSKTELGGVLIGNPYKDEQGPFLEVIAAIPAEHTKNEGAQLTFTPETWQQINEAKDKLYPEDRIVGWYHTHPRFGVFLSDRDKFIQRYSFPQPWAVAFVLDPVQLTEGFFIWSGGEPKLAPEYWVGSERRDRSFAEPRGPGEETAAPSKAASLLPTSAVSRASFAFVVAVGFLALLFLFGYVYMREVTHSETEKYVLGGLEVQKAQLDRTFQALNALGQSLAQAANEAKTAETQMRSRIRKLESDLREVEELVAGLQQITEEQQRALLALPQALPPPAPEKTTNPEGASRKSEAKKP